MTTVLDVYEILAIIVIIGNLLYFPIIFFGQVLLMILPQNISSIKTATGILIYFQKLKKTYLST